MTLTLILAPSGTPQLKGPMAAPSVKRFPSQGMRARLEELASIVPPAKTPTKVDACSAAQRGTWIPVARGIGARVEG